MRYRALGKSGLTVSEIGFGGWGIGGTTDGGIAYGPTEDAESLNALATAFDHGVTFYDTADFYGSGKSEDLIGRAFEDRRSKVVIASKVGMLADGKSLDFSDAHIRHALASSLARLRSEYLDLYQLHSPKIDELVANPHPLDLLRSFKTEGRLKGIGVSVRSPEDGVIAIRELEVDCLQVNFSMVDQRALDSGLLALCRANGIGVIARTPLCFGFLSGQYSTEQKFDATDHRARWSTAQIGRWVEAREIFSSAFTEGLRQTPAQIALRFCLSDPAISTTIPGMLAASHVEENAAASDFGPLDETTLLKVRNIYSSHQFFEQTK